MNSIEKNSKMKMSYFKKYTVDFNLETALFFLLFLKILSCELQCQPQDQSQDQSQHQAQEAGRYKISLGTPIGKQMKTQLEKQKLATGLDLRPRWLYLSHPLPLENENLGTHREEARLGQELSAITKGLAELLLAIRQRKPQKIQKLVHPQEGLYVDLKAHWSYKRLVKEIQSGRGYLYEVLLSEQDPASLYQTLNSHTQIELDYYLKKELCELKLHLPQRPEDSYRLNNPIFIYKGKQWYVYRLF